MTPPKLLVFDLDGTLIDSSVDLCQSVNAMMRQFGRPELPFSVIAGYIGDGAPTLVRRALDHSTHTDDPEDDDFKTAYAYFIRYYREHKLDTTRLYDGVLPALQCIREAAPEILMAVLTNKPVGPSRGICEGLDIAHFFFQNYGGDSFPKKKPHPQGLLALVEEANRIRMTTGLSGDLDPSQAVMIGDSAVDVETGRACGARTLGCTFGLAPEALRRAQPDTLVDHAAEWPEALGFTANHGIRVGVLS